MSKKSIIARQAKRERAVAKYHDVRAQLKKDHDYDGLSKLPRDASPVRLKNRCGLTGRPKGYMRRFGLSRNVFRLMALDGKIPGIVKASW
ncbi:MAG: 30S ribosomal protein S14 [Saprospiraceae bacterium]|nr:30S ribosomal protein S14 [Saprospiraceae bacterium]HRG69427.1 30S ribosomal protein S14 [Saprospiraceae bacterium]